MTITELRAKFARKPHLTVEHRKTLTARDDRQVIFYEMGTDYR